MPSLRAVLRAFAAGALGLAAACADSTSAPVQPAPNTPDDPSLMRLACTADVAARTVQCGAAGAPRADRIYGSGTGMKLTSSNVAIVADSFTFDVAVTNNLEYPVGTTDGVNPDPNGIRVFFVDGIHTTQGTGTVTVANADGVDVFTAAGQAYFAYPGVLQPGAATAARKWKLRFDPGVEHFTFGLYISTPVPPGGGTVQLTLLGPAASQVVGDSVRVRVRIDSASAPIQSVKAFVADRSVVLTPGAPGELAGMLSLTGLFAGPYDLRVHAVTVRADTGNAHVTIQKDAPPTLRLAGPRQDYVARPTLRIDVTCVDDDPGAPACVSITAYLHESAIASGTTTGIHTDIVGLGALWTGTRVPITIEATDSRGQKVTTTSNVYVEDNENGQLVFADSAGALAMDLDGPRLLFADSARTVWLSDKDEETRTLVQTGGGGALYGFLHPEGALFGRSFGLYDLRNGSVDYLSSPAPGAVVVEGSWAAWQAGGIARHYLETGTTENIGSGTQPDVGANGDVVWSTASGVWLWRSGGLVLVDSSGTGPVTDGINVVYLKAGKVMRWDGAARTVLSTAPAGAGPHTHYEASGGWIAYAVVDGSAQTQIRLRAPDGNDYQATSGAGQIRGLGADGSLVFASGGNLYAHRAFHFGAYTKLGKDWFTVRFRGTQLQLFLGNTAFRPTY